MQKSPETMSFAERSRVLLYAATSIFYTLSVTVARASAHFYIFLILHNHGLNLQFETTLSEFSTNLELNPYYDDIYRIYDFQGTLLNLIEPEPSIDCYDYFVRIAVTLKSTTAK